MAAETDWLSKADPWLDEAALDRAMADAGLDAIIARSGANVVYLSGMRIPGTLARHQDFVDSPRPILVVWPRDGEPTLVTSDLGEGLARASSWLDRVETYPEYVGSPWAACVDRLADLGLEDGRIGVERARLNVDQWDRLDRELSGATLVDCAADLTAVRNIKTDREIEVLRESVAIQDAAYREAFAAAEPGWTERDLHARLVAAMIDRGAEWAHGMLQSDHTDVSYGGEGPAVLDEGTAIRTDYVSYYRGYAANLSRMAVVGTPSAAQRDRYRDVREIHRGLLDDVVEPGVAAGAIWAYVRDEAAIRGYDSVSGIAGHSTGVWWHQEDPIFRPGNETMLRPGTVVCVEPILEGFWHLQDQLLVTDDGAERLSDGFDIDELCRIG